MRIEKITIAGFGCLSGRAYEFPAERAVLVLEDNEAGKSTLAAALLAGLCGFPPRRRAGEAQKMSEIYRPWDGGSYAITMLISAGGKRYEVERDFDRDRFAVRDTETGRDVTARFDCDLAKSFLQLGRDDLVRIAFVGGKEVQQFSSSPDMRARLAAVVEGSQGEWGADPAIAALESARYRLDGRDLKAGTALSRIGEEITRLSSGIAQLEASLEEAGDDATALDAARAKQEQLVCDIALLDAQRNAARLREVRERMDDANRAAEALAQLESELEELRDYATFPAGRGSQLSAAVGRMGEKKTRLEELRGLQRRLEEQADGVRTRLQASPQFVGASENDLQRLRTSRSEITGARELLQRRSGEVEGEARALRSEGIDLDRALLVRERFDALPAADRQFVRQWTETSATVQAGANAARATAAEARQGLEQIARKRAGAQTPGRVALAVGVIAAVVALGAWFAGVVSAPFGAAGAILGTVAAAVGAVLFSRAAGLGADRKAELEREVAEAQSSLDSLDESAHRNLERLQAIASAVGVGEAQAVVEEMRECESSMERAGQLTVLQGQHEAAIEVLDEAEKRAARALEAVRFDCEGDPPDALERAIEDLAAYLTAARQLQELETNDATLSRESASVQRSLDEDAGLVREILREAGLDPELPSDRAIERFGEKEALYRRFRELRDALIPNTRERVPSSEQMDRLRAEEAELAPHVRANLDEPAQPATEIEVLLRERRQELDQASRQAREIESSVGRRVDDYRRRCPEMRERLQVLEQERARAERFDAAISTAARVMREVSQETHRRWATALNTRASSILPLLNPNCAGVSFDETLGFTLTTSTGRVLEKSDVDARLSTGAKDQVYLAVRLACCGELCSSGEAIPVILDDPLIAADDSRFRSGMRYLACEFARTTQVIILSCHRSRHEALRDDPELVRHLATVELN